MSASRQSYNVFGPESVVPISSLLIEPIILSAVTAVLVSKEVGSGRIFPKLH